jgi:hypothetical protein
MYSPKRCPFLVPVMADQLWVYPVPAYCRRPDQLLTVPARETFLNLCDSSSHVRCPDYRSSMRHGTGENGMASAHRS